ncbi:ABC transporter permease [Sinorhizobium meliloti]|uniref:ABC transporter permease n=1 Tax=Rhizobium meliloti TaxID=382 RepID=UPI00299E0D1E|nr:ABC transporter permease subunit [Sinorhizobium meliloti]
MVSYLIRRVAIWVPSILLILFGVYALAYFGAGDPIKLMFMRAPGDIAYNPERLEAIRESAGLNRSFIEQFLAYLGNLLQGNWGNSLINGRSVWRTISSAAPVSVSLGFLAILLTALIGIPLGVLAGLNQNNRLDYVIVTASLVVWSVPPYVAGPLFMVGLIIILPSGAVPYGWGGLFDTRIILPLIVLSMQPTALVIRQTRVAVIEVMSEDFIRTARAKGVPERLITRRHIMRPILTPVLTQLGLILITLINGAIFVELVFGLPGIGRITVDAIFNNDYPVILAITLITSILVMVSNLVVDLLYPLVDPRAR